MNDCCMSDEIFMIRYSRLAGQTILFVLSFMRNLVAWSQPTDRLSVDAGHCC